MYLILKQVKNYENALIRVMLNLKAAIKGRFFLLSSTLSMVCCYKTSKLM